MFLRKVSTTFHLIITIKDFHKNIITTYKLCIFTESGLGGSCQSGFDASCSAGFARCSSTSPYICQCQTGYVQSGSNCILNSGKIISPVVIATIPRSNCSHNNHDRIVHIDSHQHPTDVCLMLVF